MYLYLKNEVFGTLIIIITGNLTSRDDVPTYRQYSTVQKYFNTLNKEKQCCAVLYNSRLAAAGQLVLLGTVPSTKKKKKDREKCKKNFFWMMMERHEVKKEG